MSRTLDRFHVHWGVIRVPGVRGGLKSSPCPNTCVCCVEKYNGSF